MPTAEEVTSDHEQHECDERGDNWPLLVGDRDRVGSDASQGVDDGCTHCDRVSKPTKTGGYSHLIRDLHIPTLIPVESGSCPFRSSGLYALKRISPDRLVGGSHLISLRNVLSARCWLSLSDTPAIAGREQPG